MAENTKKSKYEELEKKLSYASKNIWSEVDTKTVDAIHAYAELYKTFLNRSKSERLTVQWIVAEAEKGGYRQLSKVTKVKPGDLIYALNRDKNICMSNFTSKSRDWVSMYSRSRASFWATIFLI